MWCFVFVCGVLWVMWCCVGHVVFRGVEFCGGVWWCLVHVVFCVGVCLIKYFVCFVVFFGSFWVL
jgi:hypothetical protein